MSLANRVEGLSINKGEGQGMGPPLQRTNGHHHTLTAWSRYPKYSTCINSILPAIQGGKDYVTHPLR